ncbi:oxidative stress survival, Svf1-like protein [Phlyctochytrium arcticum]|nr:oxidative stress survival, Svf1-like protein [Phlyctochytrium arcticum]
MATTTNEYTHVPDDSLKWVLTSGATEANTFYLHTHTGDMVLVQIAYSSLNSWSPSVQVSASFHGSDNKTKKRYTANISGSSLTVASDGISVTCENLTSVYNKDTQSFHVTLKAAPALVVDLVFKATDGITSTGKVPFKKALGDAEGYVSSQFIPRATVTGTLFIDGKMHDATGLGLFVHALQVKPQCVARWAFADLHAPNGSLLLYQYEMCQGYGYDFNQRTEGTLTLADKTIALSLDGNVTLLKKTHDDFSGYEIPSAVSYTLSGTTSTSEPFTLTMTLPLSHMIDKIDLLSELPFLLRKVIQTFITAPFVYQWFEETEAVVKIGETEHTLKGRLFHENVFLYPVTDSQE